MGSCIRCHKSLVYLELPFGCELKHMKLNEVPLHDELVSARGTLNSKYIASNLADSDIPEFIFLHKIVNGVLPLDYFTIEEMINGNMKASEYFESITDKWNKEVFYILSILRLVQEGNIEIADKIYIMNANYECNDINRTGIVSKDMPIGVYEDLYEWNNENLTCFNNIIGLPEALITLLNDVMERFGRGYSASRYDDAYKNLVTLSEIILIGYNSNDKCGGKKEKFAKRLAAAIANDADVQYVYDRAKRMYKERSNETHEGNNQYITKEELKELRCAVRVIVLDFITFSKRHYSNIYDKSFEGLKREYVKNLLTRISMLQTKGLLR